MQKVLLLLLFLVFPVVTNVTTSQAQVVTLSPGDLAHLGVAAKHLAALREILVEIKKSPDATPGLVMQKMWFGNAGGNRFVWRVDFAEAIPDDAINILFYLDTDADKSTGRQTEGKAHQGVDMMLFVESGGWAYTSLYDSKGNLTRGYAASVIQDKSLFVTVDIDFHQKNGQTAVPLYVMAQGGSPLKVHSSIAAFELQGAPLSKDQKMPRAEQQFRNNNVTLTWGLHEIRAIHDNKDNVVLPIIDATFNGWRLQRADGYRTASATLGGTRGYIRATVPRDGRYYPAFIYYDNTPDAALGIYVNGKQLGTVGEVANDNNQKLYALSRPVDLQKGDLIELRNLNAGTGPYRVEDLLLLKVLFPQKASQYAFNYVDATRPWQRDDQMRITFTTTWPAQAKVLFGTTEKLGQEIAENDVPLNNHRLFLANLTEGQKYFYRLSARDRQGQEVRSELKSFVFARPRYPAAVAKTKDVPLKLSNVSPAEDWPVSSGVPLARGEVFDPINIQLINARDQSVSAQKKVLARWHDGSIKWVLLSFVAPAGQDQYRLRYGAQIREENAAPPLAAQDAAGNITVNTGQLQWGAQQSADGGFQMTLARQGKAVLGNARLLLTNAADGKTYSSAVRPDAVEIEANGAQHATVIVRGALTDKATKSTFFRYILRWQFYRNSPAVRVSITLENDNAKSDFSELKSAVLQFTLPADGGKVTLADGKTVSLRAGEAVSVTQPYDDAFTVQTPAGNEAGKRYAGWMQWENDQKENKQSVALAVRNFWQLYPKALEVRGNTLEVGIAPSITAEQYAKFKGTVEEYRSVFYLMNGTYKLRLGTSFTTEMALHLGETSGVQLDDYADNPPLLVASPQYYHDSKAFGDIGLGNEFPLVQRYDEKTASSFQNYLAQREKQHEFGLMNYGDWWGERSINWGNVEYDTPHAFILQFARTGDMRYIRAALDAETHNRDIDTVHHEAHPPGKYFSIGGGHYPPTEIAVGRVWEHSVGHTGGYFTKHPVTGVEGRPYGNDGMIESVFSSSHTWTEGHYETYFLTGDTRSLQTANKIADVYNLYGTIDYDFGNARVPGWHLIFTIGAYDATNDPFYLNAARIIVDRVLDRQTPDGGWDRLLTTGHCGHNPGHIGEAGFMVGVLMTGLKNFAESTGEQRVKDAIVKEAHFMINDMWVPEAGAFRYTSCPSTRPAPGLNLLIAEGISYAWRQTHDANLRRVTLDAMNVLVEQMDGRGKNISMELRSTARQLFDVVEMLQLPDPITASIATREPALGEGDTVQFSATATSASGKIASYAWDFGDGFSGQGAQVSHAYPNGGTFRVTLKVTDDKGHELTRWVRVSVPPALFQKEPKAGDLMIQAEDFTAQGGGEVRVVEGRDAAVGKAITYWEKDLGHWLEWKFDVPADGNYILTLKYASGSPEAFRSVQIDGKYPLPTWQKVLFVGTGGYSQNADDWRYFRLMDDAQQPVNIPLTKGTHTLRMSNLGGGMALDLMLLQKQ